MGTLVFISDTGLLLSSTIPDVELDLSERSVKEDGIRLHTHGGDIILLKISKSVTPDESSLSDSTFSDDKNIEAMSNGRGRHSGG